MPRYGAAWHWAKIEPPSEADPAARAARLGAMRARLAARFPLEAFARARGELDPKNILGSPALDELLGAPKPAPGAAAAAAAAAAAR